jgi:hypothetical protein
MAQMGEMFPLGSLVLLVLSCAGNMREVEDEPG